LELIFVRECGLQGIIGSTKTQAEKSKGEEASGFQRMRPVLMKVGAMPHQGVIATPVLGDAGTLFLIFFGHCLF
jgi:hypothetical protein